MKFKARLQWKGADTWIGAYWSRDETWRSGTVWICLIPCVPLKIDWWPRATPLSRIRQSEEPE